MLHINNINYFSLFGIIKIRIFFYQIKDIKSKFIENQGYFLLADNKSLVGDKKYSDKTWGYMVFPYTNEGDKKDFKKDNLFYIDEKYLEDIKSNNKGLFARLANEEELSIIKNNIINNDYQFIYCNKESILGILKKY